MKIAFILIMSSSFAALCMQKEDARMNDRKRAAREAEN